MKRAQAILVLGVELDEQDAATRELIKRTELAVKLWYAMDGKVPVMVCGGRTPGHRVTEAAVMRTLLQGQGVPPEAILTEDTSQNTAENFRNAAVLLGRDTRVLAVTTDYHVPRAWCSLHRYGLRGSVHGASGRGEPKRFKKAVTEFFYMVDLLLGFQDDGRRRPAIVERIFDRVFGTRHAQESMAQQEKHA